MTAEQLFLIIKNPKYAGLTVGELVLILEDIIKEKEDE